MALLLLSLVALGIWAGCAPKPSASTASAQQQADWLNEPSCLFDRTPTHGGPDVLAREFLRRDAAGAFLQTDAWFNQNTTCSGHEPGPDTHDAVAGYRLQPLLRTDTVVQLLVTYAGLGLVEYRETSPPPGQAFYRTVQP